MIHKTKMNPKMKEAEHAIARLTIALFSNQAKAEIEKLAWCYRKMLIHFHYSISRTDDWFTSDHRMLGDSPLGLFEKNKVDELVKYVKGVLD